MQNNFEKYYREFFEGKKIVKQGFGILGRGGGVVKFLIEMGANILVTDMKSEENFDIQIKEIEELKLKQNQIRKREGKKEIKIEYVFGGHKIDNFINCDFVIQASGVAKDNTYLKASRDVCIKVYQEGSLFCEIVKSYFDDSNKERKSVNIIGITGTRGKTTTTFLIKSILENSFKHSDIKVYFGGNVQGVATLELLKNIKSGDYVVMELDSWVLQGFKDIKFSPHISVFTNLMNDHMNYYHNDMREYFLDKANIFLYQNQNDKLILSESSFDACEKYLKAPLNTVFITKDIIEKEKSIFESKLIGEHNRVNISLAAAAGRECGVSEETIKDTIKNFQGVSGRLEMRRKIVKQIDDKKVIIKYYNDTTATTEEASIAALNALTASVEVPIENQEKIILISGGRDKDLSCESLVKKILELNDKNILEKLIILFDEKTTNGSEKLVLELEKNNFNNFIKAKDLNIAVNLANQEIEKLIKEFESQNKENDFIVLFSPAFASFGLFKNEYDRGDKFNEIVDKL